MKWVKLKGLARLTASMKMRFRNWVTGPWSIARPAYLVHCTDVPRQRLLATLGESRRRSRSVNTPTMIADELHQSPLPIPSMGVTLQLMPRMTLSRPLFIVVSG
jgi:hypothetical protein